MKTVSLTILAILCLTGLPTASAEDSTESGCWPYAETTNAAVVFDDRPSGIWVFIGAPVLVGDPDPERGFEYDGYWVPALCNHPPPVIADLLCSIGDPNEVAEYQTVLTAEISNPQVPLSPLFKANFIEMVADPCGD